MQMAHLFHTVLLPTTPQSVRSFCGQDAIAMLEHVSGIWTSQTKIFVDSSPMARFAGMIVESLMDDQQA